MHHFVRHTIGSNVEVIVCRGFETSFFNSGTGWPHRHFVEDRAENVSEVFRPRGVGDAMLVVIE